MNRAIPNDESVSIELVEEDLLDIDGSDDPTTAFAGKAMLGKLARLRAPARRTRSISRPFDGGGGDDPTIVKTDRHAMPAPARSNRPSMEDVRETIPVATNLGYFSPPAPLAAPAPVPAAMAPKSPTISPVPAVRNRNANSSYPPIAISVPAPRPMAMSFVSERPSRAGWLAAAVMGALILIGGSIQVATPKAAPAAPAPVAAAEPPPPAPVEEAKVVTFGDSQGVSIKPKAETPKAEPKAEPVKKPAPHWVAAKPAPKATSKLPDGSLALGKDEKIPTTSHDAPTPSSKEAKESKVSSAEQKKLRSIEQDLADLQLKAAAR